MQTTSPNNVITDFFGRKKKRDLQLDPEKLSLLVRGKVLFQEPLARYTTMRVGGPADALIFPADIEDFCQVLGYAEAEKIPVFLLGGGSNLLVRDGGIRGIVVCLREALSLVEEIVPEENHLDRVREKEGSAVSAEQFIFFRAQAGASLPRFVRRVCNEGYAGLEGLVGVVGSVGGALRMNAGTGHGEMGDRVLGIEAINRSGQRKNFLRNQLEFSYRHINLDKSWFFLETVLYLERRLAPEVKAKMKEILQYRQKTQPLNLPNAGSIFKNPKGQKAGEIIDRLGLKGTRLRGAKISELHGNWIVNLGNAKAQDILQLVELIREKIKEEEDIQIETEIQIVGERN